MLSSVTIAVYVLKAMYLCDIVYVILDNDFFNALLYHLTLFTLIKISYTFRFVWNILAT